ncbi:MAG: hypothetical protein K2Y18_01095 [Alphaproteobacteria bacterium]|jgi:hypothetical protein|nr:hypothetical protein [Alphaproteobacteria bacterium]
MIRRTKIFWKNMLLTVLKAGAHTVIIAIFSCATLQALDSTERGRRSSTAAATRQHSLSQNETVPNGAPLSSQAAEDAFSWQNAKHYESVVQIFDELADRELTSTIRNLIGAIKTEKAFFDRVFKSVISIERSRIFEWIHEHIISHQSYIDYCYPQQNSDMDENCENSSDDERSYDYGSAESENDDDSQSSSSGKRNHEVDQNDDSTTYYDDNPEREEEAYHKWQISQLENTLGISVESMDDFTEKTIDVDAIQIFLKEHCIAGGKYTYSWLLNETIEGTLRASSEFATRVYKNLNVPEELLSNILGGLWFDYDWEQYEFDDPQFLQKTYIRTLTDLLEGKRATDVRNGLLKNIRDLFTFNHHDFADPLKNIRMKYERYNKGKNWLAALIEWSVYTTYRKVFKNSPKNSSIKDSPASVPVLPLFQSFNRESYLLEQLKNAYIRAQAKYTKVYPHPDTKKVVFGPPRPNRAELDIQESLGRLKGVGRFLERYRKRGSENVFVPQLFFVVSLKPNQASPNEGQRFLEVPLNFEGLPRRPLTRSASDGVFNGISDAQYFKTVKSDVVSGRVLQGRDKQKAEEEIVNLINNAGLCKPNLVHSERGVVQALRKKKNVDKICEDFANLLKTSSGRGHYTVHGLATLGYSTNTVCQCCTPTLITLQNSHEPGGFLQLLTTKLNSMEGSVTFETTGYNSVSGEMDWTKFRLNTFVTASVDFDEESRDLAEKGQHSFRGNTNPPKETHNPDSKLYFPSDEIDISESVLLDDGTPDPYQRYFYEFVGKDMHALPSKDNPYIDKNKLKFPGAVFSSGSDSWGAGVMQ